MFDKFIMDLRTKNLLLLSKFVLGSGNSGFHSAQCSAEIHRMIMKKRL